MEDRNILRLMCLLLVCLLVTGCGRQPERDAVPGQQDGTAPTAAAAEAAPVLTDTCAQDHLYLRFQPTGAIRSGDEGRFYTPREQETWTAAFDAALAKAQSGGLTPADSGSGIWVQHRGEWLMLLSGGALYSPQAGRIEAEDAQPLYALCIDAAARLGMATPVRPAQITGLKRATLEYDGSYTVSDPEALTQIEQWFSASEELPGGTNCPFGALLTLEKLDGSCLTVAVATDSCCTWLSEGVFYDYGAGDPQALPDLFSRAQTAAPRDDTLVRICDYIPAVRQELMYATEQNFTGQIIYPFTDAYLRFGTLKKLAGAARELDGLGYRLVIWDAFRPVSAQQALWDCYPDPSFVSHPVTGQRAHCRGNAVDVTLADADGTLCEMPSAFDEFSARADRDYSDCSPEAARNAQLLQNTLERYGLTGYALEWWHFTDTADYPVEEAFEPLMPTDRYTRCEESVLLRTAPDASAPALARIPNGAGLQLLALCADCCYVSYEGFSGYLSAACIDPPA